MTEDIRKDRSFPSNNKSIMIAHQIQSRRGVALVIVLAMLVLMSGLMVAFISTATTERSASFANSGTVSARQIADSTVNTVISEIREATSVADEDVTWASQPGAIRTFGGRLQATRKPLRDGAYYQTFTSSPQDYVYKLYSADEMRVPASGGQISPFDEEVEVIDRGIRRIRRRNTST
jgi:Tfp pilus assembly protein PilX